VQVLIFERTCSQRYSVFYDFGSIYISQLMTIIGLKGC
jgi:hypothetical protein